MARLIIVIGMPGSGKSTYLQDLANAGAVDVAIDDYQKDPYDDDYLDPAKSRNYQLLVESLRSGKRVAVADRRYCIQEELDKLLAAVREANNGADIQFRYFENNLAACEQNIKQRNRHNYVESELEFLHEYSPTYNPPDTKDLLRVVGARR